MLSALWTTLKRSTFGEKLKVVGRASGEWGATIDVDIRRVSDGREFITISATSNFTVEINGRTTTYAYLNDAEVEKLSKALAQAVAERRAL